MKRNSVNKRIADALEVDRAIAKRPPKVEVEVNGRIREVTIHSPGDIARKEVSEKLEEFFARKRRNWLEYHLKKNKIKITKE